MRRVRTWGPVAGTVVVGALLLGAEPIAPKAMPPLPVPPVERQSMPPFLARITMSGDPAMSGVFESCMDPSGNAAGARARTRSSDAAPPRTACTNTHEIRPDGSIHTEMNCDKAAGPLTGCTDTHDMRPDRSIHGELSCDKANGAKASFRMVSDGTPDDLRIHVERPDTAAGGSKIIMLDSRTVRLGPCPADLKPGQMRRPGGPVIERAEASRVLDGARGVAP
jgi:hypothetical protein